MKVIKLSKKEQIKRYKRLIKAWKKEANSSCITGLILGFSGTVLLTVIILAIAGVI